MPVTASRFDGNSAAFPRDRRTLAGATLFTLLYVAMCAWFHLWNVYDRFFVRAGPIYLAYHAWKLVAIFYFLWLMSFCGISVLSAVRKRGYDFRLDLPDRLIAAFYIGGSVIGIAMYALGLLNLYYTPLMVLVAAPAIFASFPHLQDLARMMRGSLAGDWRSPRRRLQAGLAVTTILLGGFLLSYKGFFPGTDWDSLTHYIHYYSAVLRNHGLAPNAVWYHYFYSKGAGLMFLEMLWTDESGQKLVSYSMVLGAAGAIYCLSKRITRRVEWALATVTVYLSSLIFEPLQYTTAAFEKQHLFMASLIVGIVFMLAKLPGIPAESRWCWTVLLALVVVNLAIVSPTAIAFILPLF